MGMNWISRWVTWPTHPSDVEQRLRYVASFAFLAWPVVDGRACSLRAALLSLGSAELIEIDQRMRFGPLPYADRLPGDVLSRLARPTVDDATREVGRFVVAMHHSGQLREMALRDMQTQPSRLALSASLIRSADWAEPVRLAAMDIIEAMIGRCADDDVFAVLPLLFRLQGHSRFDLSRLRPVFEAWLTQGDQRLPQALDAATASVRRWAFGIALAVPASADPALFEKAAHDPDPTIAMIALRSVDALPAHDQERILFAALRAKHPMIRQYALRAVVGRHTPVPPALLRDALIDRSIGVRSFAAYTMRQQGGGDPADVWRELADAEPMPLGAVLSLASLAAPADEARMQRALRHTDSRARAAALQALLTMGATPTDDAFVGLVTDPRARIVNRVGTLCRKGELVVDVAKLRHVWSSAPQQAAGALARLLAALSPREQLGLLKGFEPADAPQRQWLNAMVTRWADRVLGFWEPAAWERQGVVDLLAAHESTLFMPLRLRLEKALSR